jgi:hypothetical protein
VTYDRYYKTEDDAESTMEDLESTTGDSSRSSRLSSQLTLDL